MKKNRSKGTKEVRSNLIDRTENLVGDYALGYKLGRELGFNEGYRQGYADAEKDMIQKYES